MTTIRYSFRPSLFEKERTIVIDDAGLVVHQSSGDPFRLGGGDIAGVHLEPATAGDDDKTRWIVSLRPKAGAPIRIDSVNVRGTEDFEHKTNEFLAVLDAIHRALAPRADKVRFTLGVRRWVIVAWRIALLMTLAAGIFGVVVAVATEEYEALIGAGAFVAFGILGLMMLRGKGGPKTYNPADFITARPEPPQASG